LWLDSTAEDVGGLGVRSRRGTVHTRWVVAVALKLWWDSPREWLRTGPSIAVDWGQPTRAGSFPWSRGLDGTVPAVGLRGELL